MCVHLLLQVRARSEDVCSSLFYSVGLGTEDGVHLLLYRS